MKTDQQRLYDPKKVRKKSEDKLTDLQRSVGNIEEIKIHVTWVPEGEEKGAEQIFEEIMPEKITNLMKNINVHIQKFNKLKIV